MELGIFMMPLHPPHRSVTDTYQEDLDKIILADKLGYTEAWVGQHFTAGTEPIASPFAFMSAAIPVTKQIKFATGVINLPCHHPATVAAEAAQFDHMSRGRFIFGIGPGALATDFQLYGNEEGWARLRKALESIDMIKKIWDGGPPYDFKGEFYNIVVDKNIVPELGTGYMPTTRAALESDKVKAKAAENPNYQVAIDQLDIAKGPDVVRRFVPEAVPAMKDAIQAVYSGGTNAEKALKTVQTTLEPAIEKVRAKYEAKVGG